MKNMLEKTMVKLGALVLLQMLALPAVAHEGHSPVGGVAHELEHLLYVVGPVAAVALLWLWRRLRAK